MKDGEGMYTYLNGDYYIGGWKNDCKHGPGKIYFINGNLFEGEFD